MRKLVLTAAMIGFVTPALGQDAKVVTPTMLTWKDNHSIPKGGQIAILVGDPTKAGDTVVQRVLFPANYAVPIPTHIPKR